MRQQFANPIFLLLANIKFPKRFNSLFELRILVQNSLKNLKTCIFYLKGDARTQEMLFQKSEF
jgi:hypothetical protein